MMKVLNFQSPELSKNIRKELDPITRYIYVQTTTKRVYKCQ